MEEQRDLFFLKMSRRGDDVTRLFFAQLHNVFTKIGFNDVDAVFFEMMV